MSVVEQPAQDPLSDKYAWIERLKYVAGPAVNMSELGRRAGMASGTFLAALNNPSFPNVVSGIRLAQVLNVEPEWLWLGRGGDVPVPYRDPFLPRTAEAVRLIISALEEKVAEFEEQEEVARRDAAEAADKAEAAVRRRKKPRRGPAA